jgi:hypothetical protein
MPDEPRQLLVVLPLEPEPPTPAETVLDDDSWEREDLEWGRRWSRPCPSRARRRFRPGPSRGPSSLN